MEGEHGKQHVGNPTRICAPKIRIRVSSRAVLIFCFSSKRGLASVRRERATALHGLAECSSRRPDTGKHSDSEVALRPFGFRSTAHSNAATWP